MVGASAVRRPCPASGVGLLMGSMVGASAVGLGELSSVASVLVLEKMEQEPSAKVVRHRKALRARAARFRVREGEVGIIWASEVTKVRTRTLRKMVKGGEGL